MRRFFDREDTRWRRLDGALHLYAVPEPGDRLLRATAAAGGALADVPGLAPQPLEYVHVTLQRLDAYVDETAPESLGALCDGIAATLETVRPFGVDFSAPGARTHAVEAVGVSGAETPGWPELITAIRAGVRESGWGDALTAPPYAPHYTIAYATDEVDDGRVSSALAQAGRPTTLLIDRVFLVAVDQRPEEGVFAFSTLRAWELRG